MKNTQASEPSDEVENLPTGVRLISLTAGLLLIVFGWKTLLPEYRFYHKMTHLEQEYLPIPAKILEVSVVKDMARSGDKHHPYIRFEYFVRGQSIWGWRFSYEDEPKHKAYWEKRMASYHVGDSITAYVSPSDPKDSFVEKKSDSVMTPVMKMLLALAFILFGALLFFISGWAFLQKLWHRRSR